MSAELGPIISRRRPRVPGSSAVPSSDEPKFVTASQKNVGTRPSLPLSLVGSASLLLPPIDSICYE